MQLSFGIPRVDSPRLQILGVLILLFPVWWILGIDQFIWPIILVWMTIELVFSNKGRLLIPPAGQIFLLFLSSLVISGFFIQESIRFLSFIQSFAYFLTACFSLIIIANIIRDRNAVEFLALVILMVLAVAAVVGLLAETGVLRIEFNSPLGSLFPSSVTRRGYGERILIRNLGHEAYFMSVLFYRVKSLFMFSTLYGTSLAFSIPLIVYFLTKSNNKARLFWLGILILFFINLVFSGGRSALLSTSLGAGFYLLVKRRSSWKLWWIFWTISALVVIGYLIFTPIDDDEFSALPDPVENIIWARSTTGRLVVYEQTLEAVGASPFFGAGTQTDTYGLLQPLGSHSFYLALLYRYGFVGLSLFACLIWTIWRATSPLRLIEPSNKDISDMNELLYIGRWILFTILLDGFFTVPLTDASTMFLEWMIIALLLQTRRLILRKG